MRRLAYYFTVVSPWCYLGGPRLEDIATRYGIEIEYLPVDAGQVFARTGGLALPARHETRKAYRLQELRRQSAKHAMPLTIAPAYFPTNPAPASYAIIAAQATGGGDLPGLINALMRAVWAEEKNVAEDAVIKEALAQNGFDPALADTGLFTGAQIYERNTEAAIAAGVFGFPFFVVGEEKFWGQDRLEDLDRHLAQSAAQTA